ncbi:MAG: hypothetical protein ACOYBS_12600 [Flavobacterium sp.]
MKKIIKLILMFGFSIYSFGQNTQESTRVDLPNFTPPSPESFKMTKYGDTSIDEFNGKVKLNIPIYNYTAGKINLPISLNYYGAGVRINDLPTQVGINWTLDVGGLITREIRGLPDELAQASNTRLNLTSTQINDLNQEDCTSQAAQLVSIISLYDTEADVFKFNFLNFSGSFYLDNNFEARLIKNDQNLKIKILGDLYTSKTFIITDTYGIKYYFGGTNATESTQSRTFNGHNFNYNTGGITSFYLYKIEHPINGIINFEYVTLPTYKIVLNSSESTTKVVYFDPVTQACPSAGPDSHGTTLFENTIIDNKLIKRIYSLNSNEEIVFNRTNTLENLRFKTVLNSIDINKASTLFNRIKLEYSGLDNLDTASRFFLTKVIINDELYTNDNFSKKHQEFIMEYNAPEDLPFHGAKKVDLLGYFNNTNNQLLSPCFENLDGSYPSNCPDRIARFNYASKGVLQRIHYPTGGFTNFEYEDQPSFKKRFESVSARVCINSPITDFGNGDIGTIFHEEIPRLITNEDGTTFTLFQTPIEYDQQVTIKLSATTTNNYPNHNALVKLKITNITQQSIQTFSCSTGFINIPYTFEKNSNYKMELDITPPNYITSNYSASGSLFFLLHVGFDVTEGAGVRIKRISNVANNTSALESIKRFYYTSYDKLNNFFSDKFTYRPNITSGGYFTPCVSGNGIVSVPVTTKTINSDYIFSDYNCSTIKFKEYTNVTVSFGGDNFELGGIEKTFKLSEQSDYYEIVPRTPRGSSDNGVFNMFPINLPDPKDNVVALDGTELKEKTFVNVNGAILKIKEKQYQYDYPIIENKYNLFGYKLFNYQLFPFGCSTGNTLSNYFIASYFSNSFDFKKTNEKEIYYLDPVPASLIAQEFDDPILQSISPTQEQLESSYKKIITIQEFTYGSLKGLPTEIKTTSSDGTVLLTKNYYPNQTSSLINVFPTEIISSNKLLIQNIVATPIQVEQYRGTDKLSTQRTVYNSWNNNLDMVLPEKILMSKGIQPLEERVVFTEYDIKGNPTIVSLKDGTKTKYFYNSLNQVILKVENYLTTQNIPAVPTWSNACTFITSYSTAMVTIYNYDAFTNQITSIVSPNCDITYYDYDLLHQLKSIRDKNGNLVQEFDHNYKP